jgi:5-methylcytosine-specific restriction endonuclease McrA
LEHEQLPATEPNETHEPRNVVAYRLPMPHAPRQPCTSPGCPELRPCAAHPVTPWRRRPGATPRTTLSGSAEQARARRVIARGRGICHVCHHPGADVADHVIARTDGGPDTEANLAPIHGGRCPSCGSRCHDNKTAAESARARRRVG